MGVAAVLRDWLKDLLPVTSPFVSFEDIDQGEAWLPRLLAELEKSDVGIVCLTKENLQSSWLLFEAGALAKRVGSARVCTLLDDVTKAELSTPLSAFQAAQLTSKDDLHRLVRTIHKALPTPHFDSDTALKRAFEVWWPSLDEALSNLPRHVSPDPVSPSTEELLLTFIYPAINSGEVDSVFDWLVEARNKRLMEATGKLASIEACLARVAGKSRAPSSLKLQQVRPDDIGAVARVEWWLHQFACFKRLDEIHFEKSQLDTLSRPLKYTASALIGLWHLREEKIEEAREQYRDCMDAAIVGDPHDYYRAIPTALLCFQFGDLDNARKFFELSRNGPDRENSGYPFIGLTTEFDKYFVLSCVSKTASPVQRDYMRQRRGQGWLLYAYADIAWRKPTILQGLVDIGQTLKNPLDANAIVGRLKSFQQATSAASGGRPISD